MGPTSLPQLFASWAHNFNGDQLNMDEPTGPGDQPLQDPVPQPPTFEHEQAQDLPPTLVTPEHSSDEPEASLPASPLPASGVEPGQGGWGQSALNAEQWGGTWVRPHENAPGSDQGVDASADATGGSAGSYGVGPGHGSNHKVSRGPKPIRGPRFSGSPLIAGLGLLGLLLTVAIMALLAVRVLDGTQAGINKSGSSVLPGGLIPGETLPGGTESGGGVGVIDGVKAGRCVANRDMIEGLVEAYSVMNGHEPVSLQDLVDADMLKADDGSFKLEPNADGGVAVIGVGECAGQ